MGFWEASAAEARLTNTTEVLIELADEVGLDIGRFIDDFSNGAATAAFEEDLEITRTSNVRGFPAFLVKYGDNGVMLGGYRSVDAFASVIDHVSEYQIVARPVSADVDSVVGFVRKYRSVAPEEIRMAFGLSTEDYEILERNVLTANKVGWIFR
ncbi:MAG: DsbA family protein [Spirochaeta sp.]|nr:DsbA family protein [Spirochaeta sp.]